MKHFKDWSIRNKLTVPLLAAMVLGGGGIIWTLVDMRDEIIHDALPEERALHGIRSASLELLSEYQELMLGHNEAVEREIDELKEQIEVYEAAFEETGGAEEIEAGLVEAIEAAEQNFNGSATRQSPRDFGCWTTWRCWKRSK